MMYICSTSTPKHMAKNLESSLDAIRDHPRSQQLKRTTLRLSPRAIASLEWQSSFWDLPKKAVLDFIPQMVPVLDEIELLPGTDDAPDQSWNRSSYAFSAGALRELNKLARERETSRDMIVNHGLITLRGLTVIKAKNYPALLDKAAGILTKAHERLTDAVDKVEALLDSDDPVADAAGMGAGLFLYEIEQAIEAARARAQKAIDSLSEEEV